MWLSAPLLLTC